MDAEKPLRCQTLLKIAHIAAHGIAVRIRADDHVLVLGFDEQDLCQPQPGFSFVRPDPERFFVFHFLQHMVDHRFDLLFVGGLGQIPQRVDLITLDRIFDMPGEKDDADRIAERTQLLRQRDAVHFRHFNIQKHQIVSAEPELLQQRRAA